MIEAAKLSEFSDDVVKFNTWFDDTRKNIIKEEGTGRYNEYLRSLFKTYLGCGNVEFVESINDEKRKWTQRKLSLDYDYKDLLELGRVTYNHISQDNGWSSNEPRIKRKHSLGGPTIEKKFLALATELISSLKNDREGRGGTEENAHSFLGDSRIRRGRPLNK